jgi:hypothetical protein
MTIYVVVLYICMGIKCEFLQSETQTYDKNVCDREVASQIERGRREGLRIDGICIDVELGKRT